VCNLAIVSQQLLVGIEHWEVVTGTQGSHASSLKSGNPFGFTTLLMPGNPSTASGSPPTRLAPQKKQLPLLSIENIIYPVYLSSSCRIHFLTKQTHSGDRTPSMLNDGDEMSICQ